MGPDRKVRYLLRPMASEKKKKGAQDEDEALEREDDEDVDADENDDEDEGADEDAKDEPEPEPEPAPKRKAAAPAKAERSRKPEREPERTREREPARRHAPIEEEPIPVFGGRLLLAGAMLLAMAVIPMSNIGSFIEPKDETIPGVNNWSVGQTATIAVTVITADYNRLACAADKEIDGSHCQFKAEKEIWPRAPDAPLDDNKATIIQPYRTWLDNKLVLITGLWADPKVAMRLHMEPPQGVAEEKLARFVATCKVRFIGELKPVRLRWNATGSWGDPDMPALVAKPESCTVSSPND